jgi:hypothetical protein
LFCFVDRDNHSYTGPLPAERQQSSYSLAPAPSNLSDVTNYSQAPKGICKIVVVVAFYAQKHL